MFFLFATNNIFRSLPSATHLLCFNVIIFDNNGAPCLHKAKFDCNHWDSGSYYKLKRVNPEKYDKLRQLSEPITHHTHICGSLSQWDSTCSNTGHFQNSLEKTRILSGPWHIVVCFVCCSLLWCKATLGSWKVSSYYNLLLFISTIICFIIMSNKPYSIIIINVADFSKHLWNKPC